MSKLTLLDITAEPLHGSLDDFRSTACDTEVVSVAADVARADESAASTLGRVNGVIHAAGVLRDALLLQQSARSFREVLAGKVCISVSYMSPSA